jgi:hypothetical protein
MIHDNVMLQDIIEEGKRAGALVKARAGALLVMVGEITYAAIDHLSTNEPGLVRLRLAHAALSLALVLLLTLRGTMLSRRAIITVALVVLFPLLPIMWIGEQASALSGSRDPFVGHHLVLLGAAVFMPGPVWMVWLVISVFAASSFVNYLSLLRWVSVPLSEPVVTALNLLVGAGIIVLRQKIETLRELYAQARAAAQALIELARVARSIRDGTASPLQTITAATLLLKHHGAQDAHLLDRIDRAAGRIQKLVATLDVYEPKWDQLEDSFDAKVDLGEQHDHLTATAQQAVAGTRPGHAP